MIAALRKKRVPVKVALNARIGVRDNPVRLYVVRSQIVTAKKGPRRFAVHPTRVKIPVQTSSQNCPHDLKPHPSVPVAAFLNQF